MGKRRVKPTKAALWRLIMTREAAFLLAVALLALIPRLVFAYIARAAALTYDEADYDMLARNLALGNGYVYWDRVSSNVPVTFRPPGYPFFISLIYRFFDGIGPYYYESYPPAVFAVRIVHALLGTATTILTYFVAKHVFTKRAASIAAVIMALYTTTIFFTAALMTENLYLPALLLALLLILKTEGNRPYLFCVLGALVLGCAIHIRPELTAFLPFLLVWFFRSTRQWRTALARWAVVAGIVIVLVTPWSIHNSRIVEQPMYLDSRTGYNLYIGYREGATGTFDMEAAEQLVNSLPQDRTGKWGIIRHNWGTAKALEYIREHPLDAAALVPLKFLHFWDLPKREYLFAYSYGYIGAVPTPLLAILFALVMLPFAVVVLFGIVGVLFTRPWPGGILLFLLLILLYTVGHSLVFGEPRMHMPLVPCITILAAQGVVLLPTILRQWRDPEHPGRRSLRRRAVAALCLALCFVGMWSYGFCLSWDKFEAVFGPDGHQSRIDF